MPEEPIEIRVDVTPVADEAAPKRIPTSCETIQDFIRRTVVSVPEGKPSMEKLRAVFDSSITIWENAGLFTPEREARGFVKPDFERDYAPLLTKDRLAIMVSGSDLNRGYTTPVWAPMDVPLESEDPEKLSYFKLLLQVLLHAYEGTAGGKTPNTLLIGPEKSVLTREQIDAERIMWRWAHFLHQDIVHSVQHLGPNTVLHDPMIHDGVSEQNLFEGLGGVAKTTGGVFRVERGQVVMPADVGFEEGMSGQDWLTLFNAGEVLPLNASLQNVKQALAFTIHCLKTEGWIPDFNDSGNPETARVVLVPKTFVPDEYGGGQVPVLRWDMQGKRYGVGGINVAAQSPTHGVRIGMEIN